MECRHPCCWLQSRTTGDGDWRWCQDSGSSRTRIYGPVITWATCDVAILNRQSWFSLQAESRGVLNFQSFLTPTFNSRPYTGLDNYMPAYNDIQINSVNVKKQDAFLKLPTCRFIATKDLWRKYAQFRSSAQQIYGYWMENKFMKVVFHNWPIYKIQWGMES